MTGPMATNIMTNENPKRGKATLKKDFHLKSTKMR